MKLKMIELNDDQINQVLWALEDRGNKMRRWAKEEAEAENFQSARAMDNMRRETEDTLAAIKNQVR